jgi:peptidylprolyl isomerase
VKKYIFLFALSGALSSALLFSNEKSEDKAIAAQSAPIERKVETDPSKISEAFGHLIGKNIKNIGFKFEIDAIVKGLRDFEAGKPSPLNEMECISAISAAQEQAFNELAEKNLNEANTFMEKNAKEDKVAVLEKGKLHYHINQEGKGAVVEEHSAPVLTYTGKFIDGSVLGASKEEGERIVLDETIPGIKQGVIGMKEGEKRTIYIHPDLAYGVSDAIPPNSLLTFEVELIKANTPKEEVSDQDLPVDLSSSTEANLTDLPPVSDEETPH